MTMIRFWPLYNERKWLINMINGHKKMVIHFEKLLCDIETRTERGEHYLRTDK